MGMTLFTNNALSSISDPEFFNPGWDTTGLKRMEIFTYGTVGGGNMAIGETKSTPVASPQMVAGTPFAEFTARGDVVPHVRLGLPDSALMTWLCLFDPAGSALNRLIMSSYAGTNDNNHPGVSLVVDGTGRLGMFIGLKNTTTLEYGSQFVPLSAFSTSSPVLLALTLNNKTGVIKDLTNGLSNTATLLNAQERSFGPDIYVGKGPNTSYGSVDAKNRIAAYMVFDRVLTDAELATMRTYLLRAVQAKFPAVTF